MKCIEPDQIATVLALPPDDARRRHLEECPRCASRVLIYRRFLSDTGVPGADPEAADQHLAAVVADAVRRPPRPETDGFLARLAGRFAPRPLLAAAAVLVVAATVLWWGPWRHDGTVLRSADGDFTGGQPVILSAPETLEDGGVRLSWHPLGEAGGYIIRFRNADLDEIGRFGPFPDTSWVLTPSVFPPDTPSPVLWRVIAVKNGDEIGRSEPASLHIR